MNKWYTANSVNFVKGVLHLCTFCVWQSADVARLLLCL